jgi:hypothetical protein
MSTIVTIQPTDVIANSRADINTNFSNLNADKAELASPTFTGTVTSPAVILSSETASTIASLDANKNIKSLALATYPSLTELSYVKGLSSALQTQLTAKAPSTSPTFATSITGSYLTASEILITDGSKNIVSAAVATYPSLTELSYVKGVTSAIQTQINAIVTTYKNGTTTYDLSTASGNVVIAHGLGVAPKKVKIFFTKTGTDASHWSDGAWDGTNTATLYADHGGGSNVVQHGNSTTNIFWYVEDQNNNAQKGTITVDATNITIAMTKAGTPTGTANIRWEANS